MDSARMGSQHSAAVALLLGFVLSLLPGPPSILGQDLRETDALCTADSCFVVHFQRKTFLDSWRSCKEGGGNLVTIKRKEDAGTIAQLFSSVDLRHSRTKVRVWIGLQRQPRQCSATQPLRGFSWTTGDQDTEYTNWQGEDSAGTCSAPRCVVVGYDNQKSSDNLKWVDASCMVHMDGYLCRYAYKGMCSPLWSEGAGKALYTTPFGLLSTLLTHVPPGTVATLPCLSGSKRDSSVLCTLVDDSSAGWSRDPPLCSDPPAPQDWCQVDNGGCEHFCRADAVHFYCECVDGYQLAENGHNCELLDVCERAPCKFECVPVLDSYRCACPDGYMLAPDEHGCMDVDECLQSPCEHVCVNSPGSFECRCWEGYLLDDEGVCEDADECMANPCEHACENTVGSHICHCNLGFSPVPEDTSRCQDTDECQIAGTCQQMCVNFEGGFQCYCEEGYQLMSDLFSCQKMEDDYDQSAATPPFAWATHQARLLFDPRDYDWGAEQRNTNWPPDDDRSLKLLTDPPKLVESGVIWVSTSHREDSPDALHPLAQIPVPVSPVGVMEVEWSYQAFHTTASPTTEPLPITTTHWYEDEDETTTAPPLHSTSTLLEGAWNWWNGITTFKQNLRNPEDWTLTTHPPTVPGFRRKTGDQLLSEPSELPEDGNSLNGMRPHEAAVPTQDSLTQSPAGGAGGAGEVVLEGSREKQSSAWLLLAILIPVCIFTVLMVVLGIVYCNCFGSQPRHKKAADCYHWVSGAHNKQGAPSSLVGATSHV